MSDNVLAGWSVLTEWPRLRLGHSVRTDRHVQNNVEPRWHTVARHAFRHKLDGRVPVMRPCSRFASCWHGAHQWRNEAIVAVVMMARWCRVLVTVRYLGADARRLLQAPTLVDSGCGRSTWKLRLWAGCTLETGPTALSSVNLYFVDLRILCVYICGACNFASPIWSMEVSVRGGQSCCATEQCQHRSSFPAADGAGRVRPQCPVSYPDNNSASHLFLQKQKQEQPPRPSLCQSQALRILRHFVFEIHKV